MLFGPIEQFLKPQDRANFVVIKNELASFGWPFTMTALFSALLWFSLARCLWAHRICATAPRLLLIAVVLSFVARGLVVPKIAEVKSYRPFMIEVNRLVGSEHKLYLYGAFLHSDPLVFYRGDPLETLDLPAEEIAAKIGRGDAYSIMAEKDFLDLRKLKPNLPSPLLKSTGKGPEGDLPLVLVRVERL